MAKKEPGTFNSKKEPGTFWVFTNDGGQVRTLKDVCAWSKDLGSQGREDFQLEVIDETGS